MKNYLSCLGLALIASATAQSDPYMLTDLVRDLSKDPNAPAAVEAILGQLGQSPQAVSVLTEGQRKKIGALILQAVKTGEAPAALNYLPPATVSQMGAALQAFSTPAEPAPQAGPQAGLPGGPQVSNQRSEALGLPTDAPAPEQTGPADLGLGLQRGDVPDPDKLSRYPASSRLAAVLNELALNSRSAPELTVTHAQGSATTPDALVELIAASGHSVEVRDARYFANFADLNYKGKEVATPFWIDTQLPLPKGGTLLVPAAHAQHELIVRGPQVNADVSFFMGIDGQAKFRPMLNRVNDWSGSRVAHTYSGEEAAEAVRVAGEVRRSFEANKAKHPELPHGGYFHLGVCNDSNAFIEQALTGSTTLYPLSRDPIYYQGDGEIDHLSRNMPIDGRGAPADLARVLGSLPAESIDELKLPKLRADLQQLGGKNAKGLSDLLPR